MFSAYNQAKTSLLDITADLNQQFSIDMSKEALHKRCAPQGVKFLEALISSYQRNGHHQKMMHQPAPFGASK